jgi:serine/threonine protein kinase
MGRGHRSAAAPVATLSDYLSGLSDAALVELAADLQPGVWGPSGSITVGGQQVFAKRVPLTDLELARPYSTRNHFRLPTFYSYGVGSAGMGAWRELAGHQATTGQPGFPVLLHHRVTATACPLLPTPWGEDGYVAYWRGSPTIGRYMDARRRAHHELWIVLEHIPHPMVLWLMMHQEQVDDVLAQLFDIIASLRQQGIVHFDAHLANVVTDGQWCRLGDFGLVMSSSFELNSSERAFLARHTYYDIGVVLGYLGMMLLTALGEHGSARHLRRDIDQLDDLPVNYHPAFIETFKRYRDPICYMVNFLVRMQRPTKRARYEDQFLAALLRSSGLQLD